jgi:prolyl oligopeptidase
MGNTPLHRTAALTGLCCLFTFTAFTQLKYPVTKKVDQTDNYFGTTVSDPYRWLENDTAAETRKWENTEQAFTEAYLSRIPFRAAILNRLKEIVNYSRSRDGFKVGDYIFWTQNDGLQNQSVYYYQQGSNGKPKVFLDPNQLSADGSVSVSLDNPSTDRRYFAWGINRNGSDLSTEFFTEIATGRQLADSIEWMRGTGVAWDKDGFFYTRFPKPRAGEALTATANNSKIFYHRMGQPQSMDQLIYEDTAHPNLYIVPQTTEDGRFLLIQKTAGFVGYEVLYRDLAIRGSSLSVLFKGYQFQYNIICNDGDRLLVHTNDGADRFRVIVLDPRHKEREHWQEIIPEKKELLRYVSAAGGKLFAVYLHDASTRVDRYSYTGAMEGAVGLPALGSANGFYGYRDDSYVFYNFESYTFPPCIYRYDLLTGRSEVFRQSRSRLALDSFVTEQVFYPGKDGTSIPLFLVHKKGVGPDRPHPTMLYAYGGFDISLTPHFSTMIFPLLENDGIFALANIRGGGEYGESWHRAGMLEKKQNVFDDFIAAAEWLIQKGYTTKEKLAIRGGSNGGLLIGAVMTQRPDLCKVAIPEVGVMDMLRFQHFTTGIYWVSEYGSSDSVAQFTNLYKYSPLHNIRSGTVYPATLVITADHDDRVVPMHSFKFAATLQEKQAGTDPVLIRISINQGHGASGSSLEKDLEERADMLAFLFYNMGITPY